MGFQIISKSSSSRSLATEALEQEYQVLGMPTGYLVDREGNIVDVYLGAKPTKVLRGKIEELLAAS